MQIKIHYHSDCSAHRGSTLSVTVLTLAIASIITASMLSFALHQQRASARSAAWNTALPIAEAGIEEALTHLQRSAIHGSLFVNGWEQVGGNAVLRRDWDDKRLIVSLTPGETPVITARGFVPAPLSLGEVSRTVEVRAFRRPIFSKALFGIQQIRLGGTFLGDSFDSENLNYSNNGQYDPTRRRDKGDVATNGRADLGFDVGSTIKIYGRADTGPGGEIATKNASIGSKTWVNSGQVGIEPGYSLSDMNVDFPDVELPFHGGYFTPQSETVEGVRHKYVLHSANYRLSSLKLSGTETVLVRGSATLLVDENLSTAGGGTVLIEPGANLRIYVASGTVSLGGSSIMNQTGLAKNFSLLGLPGLQAIKVAGNGEVIGTIYAPQSSLTLTGGGSSPLDFVGAAIARTITTAGQYKAHYDEALSRREDGSYVITSWREI